VQLALDQNLTCLIIEGDSKIIIDLAKKVLNGRYPGKKKPIWCLISPLYIFQALLRPSLTLTPSHIQRIANKVANRLANAGVDSMQHIILHDFRQSRCSPLWLQYEDFAQMDGLFNTRLHLHQLSFSSKLEMIKISEANEEEHKLVVDSGI